MTTTNETTSYGDAWAPIYDDVFASLDPEPAVDVLAELAAGGRALELGVGTGRVALPLAARGVDVHGIEGSRAMVDVMRGKPGGAALPVTIGDFAGVPVDGEFALIYAVFSTIFGLLEQTAQVACFAGVERHLAPAGVFVVEAFVPDPARFDRGQRVHVNRIEDGRVDVLVSRYDPVGQRVTSQHVLVRDGRIELYPVDVRFAWPSELDLMARLAGLRLRERWRDWDRGPFTGASPKHVSIYERAVP